MLSASKFQNYVIVILGLRCFIKKKVVLRNLVPVGLIPSTLCKAHRMYVWHACTNALNDPTRSSGTPGFGIWPVLAPSW